MLDLAPLPNSLADGQLPLVALATRTALGEDLLAAGGIDWKPYAKLIAERLRDNALFMAFAPADKPRIALAIVVENAGFGAGVAAPIVKKALDYYLLGKRPGQKEITKVPKEDAETLRPLEDVRAEDTQGGEPKPGLETPGNKE